MKLTRLQLLALLLGASLLIAGVAKAEDIEEDEYDDGPDDDVDDELEEESEVSDENVVVLTGDNFDSMISSHKYALVEFYAPWCGHCKDLAPHYAQAATALKAYNPEILIAKVDATEEETLAEQHDVQGFPTLKWFVDGESVDYDGGRTAETIIKWVKKKTGPPADTVDDVAALEQLERESEAVVVGYFTEFKGEEFDVFLEAAGQLGDATFAQTTSAAVAEKAGLTKAPGLSVVTNFKTEEKRATTVMEGAWEVQQLLTFVKGESVPLLIPFSQDTQDMIFSSGIEKHIMLMGPADALTADSEAIKAAMAAAKPLKGSAVFVTTVLDEEEGEGGDLAEFFGIDEEQQEPVAVGFDMNSHMKFHMKEKLAADTLLAFAKSVVNGTAEPFFKSDPIPEEPLDGGVTVVVGKSFDEIVKDPKKDVLLEVYAPWCGHCKSLAPIYRKLAKRFAPIDSVVVAKMDGTRNEHVEAMPEGFPLIKFFPAEEGAEAVEFDGERTLLDLTKFIKQHARIPYELAKKKPASDEADAAPGKAKDEL